MKKLLLALLFAAFSITAQAADAPFTLPPLPYAYGALAPFIDETTIVHYYDNDFQGYVDKLNAAY